MRKFIVFYQRNPTAIVEVEVEKLSFMDDPMVPFRKPNEWIGRIVSPSFVFEKDKVTNKPKNVEACWWMFYDSPDDAKTAIGRAMELTFLKKISNSPEDKNELVTRYRLEIDAELSKVEIIML